MRVATVCSSAPYGVDDIPVVPRLGWAGQEDLRQLTFMSGALANMAGYLHSAGLSSFSKQFLWDGLTSRYIPWWLWI